MTVKALSDIRRKLKILKHAQKTANVYKTCRYFGISREIFYQWKKALKAIGETALINSKPCPQNPKIRVSKPIEDKIIYIRKNYHFGALKISWYLERYHGIKVSSGGVQGVLKRNGLNRLPDFARKRSKIANFQRYEKSVPGHHIQMDVKFLKFITENNRKVKRFQYTTIDDATRIRVLKIYKKHTQKNAIDFVDHVIEKLPFLIHTIRTDNVLNLESSFMFGYADSHNTDTINQAMSKWLPLK